MLKDLDGPQKALADYMSDISEEAYSAGWIDRLEFSLWDVLEGRTNEFGRVQLNEEKLKNLKSLSEAAKGWIIYDSEKEESFVSFTEWEIIRKNNNR